ncbi:colony stimulating factor 3 (granulocyte) a [Conger conger]|nr:colony stimulating factor 3 (granulocyte) a [Conger conger]
MEHPDFLRVVEHSQNLVNKILKDIPDTHKSCVNHKNLTLPPSPESNLEYMESLLRIPRAPLLKGLSAEFTLEMCLSRISEGLQMYQDVLSTLHNRVSNPEKMKDMQADVRDLLAQITKMQDLGRFQTRMKYGGSGLASRLSGGFEVQVAAHLSLLQLQDFSQHIFRSLRNMTDTDPDLNE